MEWSEFEKGARSGPNQGQAQNAERSGQYEHEARIWASEQGGQGGAECPVYENQDEDCRDQRKK